MPEMLPRWLPQWAATMMVVGHMLTTVLGLVWLIVRATKTERRFNDHIQTCHPEQVDDER